MPTLADYFARGVQSSMQMAQAEEARQLRDLQQRSLALQIAERQAKPKTLDAALMATLFDENSTAKQRADAISKIPLDVMPHVVDLLNESDRLAQRQQKERDAAALLSPEDIAAMRSLGETGAAAGPMPEAQGKFGLQQYFQNRRDVTGPPKTPTEPKPQKPPRAGLQAADINAIQNLLSQRYFNVSFTNLDDKNVELAPALKGLDVNSIKQRITSVGDAVAERVRQGEDLNAALQWAGQYLQYRKAEIKRFAADQPAAFTGGLPGPQQLQAPSDITPERVKAAMDQFPTQDVKIQDLIRALGVEDTADTRKAIQHAYAQLPEE